MNGDVKKRIKDALRPAYYIYLKPKIKARCRSTNNEYELFNGKHYGETCCIVANGASLKVEDLNILAQKQILCLGMNKIFALYDRTTWRPRYYFVQDPTCIRNYYKELVGVSEESTLFMRPTGQAKYDIEGAIHFSVNYTRSWRDLDPMFSDGKSNVYFDGKTVAYTALQFAVYMGFTSVYLLGFDCDYGANNIISRKSYPDDRMYDPKKTGMPPDIDYWFRSYEVAKEYCDERAISIVNLTRGGNLEVFPRLNFEDALEKL